MSSDTILQVRSVLIPLTDETLLLPNAVVAEVMNYTVPTARDDAADWLTGDLPWRGKQIPVISLEGMMGRVIQEPARRGRLIILNTLNGESRLPHIGLVAQAIPSLVQVTVESIAQGEVTDESLHPLIKQIVNINDKQALIPDLDELERRVLDEISKT